MVMQVNPQRRDRGLKILWPRRFISRTVPDHQKAVGNEIVYISKYTVLEDLDTIESGTDRTQATENDRTLDIRDHDRDKVAGHHDVADSWDSQNQTAEKQTPRSGSHLAGRTGAFVPCDTNIG
jgi:hypothetical protein